MPFDRAVGDALHRWVSDAPSWVVDVLGVLTDLGSPATFYVLAIPVVVVLAVFRHLAIALFVALAVWGGGVLNVTTKSVVGRERPVFDDPIAIASGKSFPSGHAMLSTIVYGAALVVLWPRLPARWRPVVAAAAVLLVVVIGFTRVALGVHHLSDVLGGFAMGAAWLALCAAVSARFAGREGLRS